MSFASKAVVTGLLLTRSAMAFDPFSLIAIGSAVDSVGGVLGEASEHVSAIGELYEVVSEDEKGVENLNKLDKKIREVENAARDAQYTREEISTIFEPEKMANQTLLQNVRYITRSIQKMKRILKVIGVGSKKSSQISSVQQNRTTTKILRTQNQILYQVASSRLEDKSKDIEFKRRQRRLLRDDLEYRKRISRRKAGI